MKKLIILIIVIIASFNSANAQILPELEKVKEIKLLESNRDDVRKILADYRLETSANLNYQEWFHTDNSTISIRYSEGKCTQDMQDWEVPKFKVIEATIVPNILIQPVDLGFNLANFGREKVYTDSVEREIYYNKNIGISIVFEPEGIESVTFQPSKTNYDLMCNKKAAKKFYLSKGWFLEKKRLRTFSPNAGADVIDIVLNLSDGSNTIQQSDEARIIKVFTKAIDFENDVLTYNYKVSGGKIIGYGENVIWDLSGVKAGTYMIKISVDDGCGFCGKSMTKTVVVKECPNCKQN